MFADRIDAGRQLAQRLEAYAKRADVVVLGLPRGGVPVASEVAAALGAPLDVILVRKLGLPFRSEVAMGAIGEDEVVVIDPETIRRAEVSDEEFADVVRRERSELERRRGRYRPVGGRKPLAGRVAVIVDDGIATGSTAKAACQVARASGAREIVVAVPVAPCDWRERFGDAADVLISLETPTDFRSVGEAYVDFRPTSDQEVVGFLGK